MGTTIAIQEATREALKEFGRKGKTYDEILRELMEIAKLHNFLEGQKRILREETFYAVDEL